MLPYQLGETSSCMQKLDRQGWEAGFVVAPHGSRVGVRINRATDLERVMTSVVPPTWVTVDEPGCEMIFSLRLAAPDPRPGVRHYHLLYAGITRIARSLEADEVVADLREHLRRTIAATSRDCSYLAGMALSMGGKAILFPHTAELGRFFVEPLLAQGASVVSDGLIILDETGRVRPEPLPEHPAPDLEPLPVGIAVLVEGGQAQQARPRALSPGQGSTRLFSQSLSARIHSAKDLKLLCRLAAQTPIYEVRCAPTPANGELLARLCRRQLAS